MLYGRAAELAVGERVLERARGGEGGVLLLSGEPGIGKSALAMQLALSAEQQGARVATGRAWEVGAAPAYWPWTQALAALDIELERFVRTDSAEMAAAQRLVAYDRIARAIAAASEPALLLIWLDDLHAADAASLELALVVARSIRSRKVAIVATTRENELRHAPVHDELIAKLAREGERVPLRRLDEPSIAEWLRASHSDDDAGELLRLTEGNPLFVREALQLGARRFAGAAGGGVAAILREHTTALSAPARELLAVAAVLGREATRSDVLALGGGEAGALDAAANEGLLRGVLSSGDPVTFSHVLLRDSLYESLPVARRQLLHAAAARLLHGRGVASLAHHLLEAGDEVPAAEVCGAVLAAAQAALDRHGAADALALVARARVRMGSRIDERAGLELALLEADARMRTGDEDAARAAAQACADDAARLHRPREQARAALIYGSVLTSGRVDPTMVRLLEAALAALPESEGGLRSRLTVRLASAIVPPKKPEEMELARRLALDGLALARQIGDPAAVSYALRFVAGALGYNAPNHVRIPLVEELLALAEAQRDELTLVQARVMQLTLAFEDGQPGTIDHFRALSTRYCAAVESLPLPQMRWRATLQRATLAGLEGRFADARAHAELARVESGTAFAGLLACAMTQLSLSICNGDLAAVAPYDGELVSMLSRATTFSPILALTHALFGRFDAARAALGPVVAMPRGFPALLMGGDAAALMHDVEIARLLYPLLRDELSSSRFFFGPNGCFPFGPTERVLGELALVLGLRDEGERHLRAAVAVCRRMGLSGPLVACERALQNAGVASEPLRPIARGVVLRREGELWTVSAPAGAPIRLKHNKGLEYLSALIASPGQSQLALALVGAEEAPADAGAILDGRAKDQYRDRIEALEDRLTEAEANADAGAIERARAELDAIAEQLAGALGLGGRDRKAASNLERARINVQRRIKDAIRRIAEHDAALGRYLEATVKTGTYCVYEPV